MKLFAALIFGLMLIASPVAAKPTPEQGAKAILAGMVSKELVRCQAFIQFMIKQNIAYRAFHVMNGGKDNKAVTDKLLSDYNLIENELLPKVRQHLVIILPPMTVNAQEIEETTKNLHHLERTFRGMPANLESYRKIYNGTFSIISKCVDTAPGMVEMFFPTPKEKAAPKEDAAPKKD